MTNILAGTGIVIAVPKKYQKICLSNVQNIRAMRCELPIEIWEIGTEITSEIRAEFAKIQNLSFKKVDDFCDNPAHWRGFQVKAFIIYHTNFKEVFLLDADAILHQNPSILLQDENYLKTGAYFFKDLEKWQFTNLNNKWVQFRQQISFNKFTSAKFFIQRKKWLTNLLPHKSNLFPEEWVYMYQNEIPNEPVKEALQESGVVLINKEIHSQSLEYIFQLNNNHKETYKFIWGDKETFWLACVMANKPFAFNPTSGYFSADTNRLTHDYKGKKFFSQKG